MSEVLQELRAAQTGAQVMFAFALALAFSPRFHDLDPSQLRLYIATLVLDLLVVRDSL